MKKWLKNNYDLRLIKIVSLFIFCFGLLLLSQPTQAAFGDYNKADNGTLAAGEWNHLIEDFLTVNGGVINGNVAIGTSSTSTYALNVNGTVNATNFIGSLTGTLSSANVSNGAFGSNTGGGNYSFPGDVGIGTTNPNAKLHALTTTEQLRLGYDTSNYNSLTVGATGSLTIAAVGTNPNITLTPGGTGYTLLNGSVGIGTTSPLYKLHLFSSGAADMAIQGGGSSNKSLRMSDHLGNLDLVLMRQATTDDVFIGDIDNNSGDLFLRSGGATGLTLLSGGNVGIGTTTPAAKLHTLATTEQLRLGYDNVKYNSFTVDSVGSLTIAAVGTNPNITLTPGGTGYTLLNGSVGIGVTGPSAVLHLKAGTTAASSAPLKFTTGTNMTAAEAGAMEWDGSRLYMTTSTSTRQTLAYLADIGTSHDALTLTTIGSSPTSTGMTLNNQVLNLEPASVSYGGVVTTSTQSFAGAKTFTGTATFNNATYSALFTGGPVGIGTATPTATIPLSLFGSGTYNLDAGAKPLTNLGAPIGITDAATKNYVDTACNPGTGQAGFWTLNGSTLYNNAGDNVGIGTSAPGAYKLKVAGDMAVTGSLQVQTGADFAEEFITNEDLPYGTVVVMGDQGYKSVKPCDKSYDNKVVGIVSNNPSVVGGRVEAKSKAIVAMMGVVKAKVTNINGPIKRGDLLVSSGIRGYAMKASSDKLGTVIGKALEDLNTSSGEVNVLVNLQ